MFTFFQIGPVTRKNSRNAVPTARATRFFGLRISQVLIWTKSQKITDAFLKICQSNQATEAVKVPVLVVVSLSMKQVM